jgi:hypothetical protein
MIRRWFPHLLCLAAFGFPTAAFADDCEHGKDLSWQTTPSNPSRMLAISSNAMKMTTTTQGITFNSNYDNGSLFSAVGAGGNVFNLQLFEETGEIGLRKYHFRFTMTGDLVGRTLTLNLDHSEIRRPFVRFAIAAGWGPWRRMTTTESPNLNQMILTPPAGTVAVECAFFEPLGYGETHERIRQILSKRAPDANVTSEVIGLSFQGRDMHMLTITDTSIPDTGKQRVWMHARAHAGEVTSAHSMLGFLARAVEDSDTGKRLRQNCIIHIIPILNIDGTFLGLTRWDSQGIDPERQWPNPNRIPETAALKRLVDQFMASPNPIKVALNMHSTVGDFADNFFFKHVRPCVTIDKEIIVQRYIDSLNNASTLFDNASPQTSCLSATLFIESYFWNNWGAAVMAVTHEGHYYERTSSTADVTGTDYFNLGKDMGTALIEYFNLPPLPTSVPDWAMYESP